MLSNIPLSCGCGHAFSAEPHRAGQQVPCPACGAPLLVAAPPPRAGYPVAQPVAPKLATAVNVEPQRRRSVETRQRSMTPVVIWLVVALAGFCLLSAVPLVLWRSLASNDVRVQEAVALAPSELPEPVIVLSEPPPPPDTENMKDKDSALLEFLASRKAAANDYSQAVKFQYWAVANRDEPDGQYNLACYYARDGQKDAAFYWLQKAAREEGVDQDWAVEDPDLLSLRADPRWPSAEEHLRECNLYWRHSGHQKLVVIRPFGYTKDRPLPVLVGLHGMGHNPDGFVSLERYQKLANQMQVVFVGVSGTIPRGRNSFVWSEDHQANARRVQEALDKVAQRVDIAEGQVVLFGFSQGAQAAAETAARDPRTFAGAIVMSPGGLEIALDDAVDSGSLGTQGFICTCGGEELRGNVYLTAEFARLLKRFGARVQHLPYPGVEDHALPEDYEEKLPEWVDFILRDRR